MPRISVYDPFADVFPSIFRSMFAADSQPQTGASAAAPAVPTVAMRVDVIETSDGYLMRADLPGVPKEAIQIEIDANRVTVRAQPVRDAQSQPQGRVLRSERFDGHYARSFSLSEDIDDTRATARVENGVLELTLPRKAGVGPTKLTVQ